MKHQVNDETLRLLRTEVESVVKLRDEIDKQCKQASLIASKLDAQRRVIGAAHNELAKCLQTLEGLEKELENPIPF